MAYTSNVEKRYTVAVKQAFLLYEKLQIKTLENYKEAKKCAE